MEPYPTPTHPMDARFASWLSNSPSSTAGYHLRCGTSFPRPVERPHGTGPGWQARAVAAVVRECYRLGLVSPALEEVEVVTLSVLHEPPEEDQRPRPPLAPDPRERWERAVVVVSEASHRIMSHGPASGSASGEVLHTGGMLRVEASGLPIETRVDLIWRRPDGALEAVLVVEEPWEEGKPVPTEDDWHCVLAAAVVSKLYRERPDLHTVWTAEGAARVDALSIKGVEEKLRVLRDSLATARGFEGLLPGEEPVLYGFGPWSAGEARQDGAGSVGSAAPDRHSEIDERPLCWAARERLTRQSIQGNRGMASDAPQRSRGREKSSVTVQLSKFRPPPHGYCNK